MRQRPSDPTRVAVQNSRAILDYSSRAATKQFIAFSKPYFRLAELQLELPSHLKSEYEALGYSDREMCINIAKKIHAYLDAVGDAYTANPEESSKEILTVMDLWTSMDKAAVQAFRLLEDYRPGLPENVFDSLHLPLREDMERLRSIEIYLQKRHTACHRSHLTLFSDSAKECFAQRYYLESEEHRELEMFRNRIESDAWDARDKKLPELQRSSKEYENLIRSISNSACVFTTDERNPLLRTHDDRACTKCYLQRKANRMRIQVHEWPLPEDETKLRAVIVELRLPEAFVAYRDATRRIISALAQPGLVKSHDPKMKLEQYSELRKYEDRRFHSSVTLASNTKSFLQTHHASVPFPVELDQICVPNGLKWNYFVAATTSCTMFPCCSRISV